jgi:hypothetical protein
MPPIGLLKSARIHLAYPPLDAIHTNFIRPKTYDWSEPRVCCFECGIFDAAPPNRMDPERCEMRQWMCGGDLAQGVADVCVEDVGDEEEGEEDGEGCWGEHFVVDRGESGVDR